MKKILALFLAVVMVILCFSALAATIPDELPKGTTTATARLYKKASTKNGSLGNIKVKASVEIIGQTKSYYRVVYGNNTGYILKKYIELDEGAATEEATTTSTASLGTRKNPAKVGDKVSCEVSSYVYGNGKIEITLVSAVRGQAAYNQLLSWNKYNDAPSAGKEYALLYFRAKLTKDTSGADKGYEVNYAQFDYADKSFATSRNIVFAVVEPDLDAKLFEGSITEGYVIQECNPNETSYAVFDEKMWFQY